MWVCSDDLQNQHIMSNPTCVQWKHGQDAEGRRVSEKKHCLLSLYTPPCARLTKHGIHSGFIALIPDVMLCIVREDFVLSDKHAFVTLLMHHRTGCIKVIKTWQGRWFKVSRTSKRTLSTAYDCILPYPVLTSIGSSKPLQPLRRYSTYCVVCISTICMVWMILAAHKVHLSLNN